MHSFSRVLKTEEQNFLHFSFDYIISSDKKKYHISVMARGPQQHHFVMEEKYGRWKITEAPLPPDWIGVLEHLLEEMICQHETEQGRKGKTEAGR